MSAVDTQYRFLLSLLLDQDLREEFAGDPAGTLSGAGLSGAEAEAFLQADFQGILLDAGWRRRYLMSALCRAYPLSSAAIGTFSPGALSLFLGSRSLYGPLGARTAAFGDHLARLLDIDGVGFQKEVVALLSSFLSFERGIADSAARMRERVESGGEIDPPERYNEDQIARGRPALAPYTVLAQLPCSPAVLKGALYHTGPEDAWLNVEDGRLDPERVRTVARAEPSPVTVLARGVVRGQALSVGVPSLIEVSHLSAELSGLQAQRLSRLDGSRAFPDLSPRDQELVQGLATAGMMVL